MLDKKKIFLIIVVLLIGICNVIYARYVLILNSEITVKSQEFYFEANIENTNIDITEDKAELDINIKNYNGDKINLTDINYEIKLLDNEKFTFEINDESIDGSFSETIIGNELNDKKIKIIAKVKENALINEKENITVKILSNYPYKKEYNFQVTLNAEDKVKPSIELSADKTEWTNQDVKLKATFQDNESGIVGYAWTDTETEPTSWNTISQTTIEQTQTKTISSNTTKYFWAKDKKGNINYASIIVDNIDKIAPVAPTIRIIDISIRATGWKYTIDAIGATDNDSKIKNYEFLLGTSSSSLTTSTKLVTGTTDPNYTIKVRVQDNAGNYSEYSNVMVLNIERLYIRQLYQALRANGGGAESEIDGWEKHTTSVSAAQLALGIFDSEESGNLYSNVDKQEMVERLYEGILGRNADSSGLETYSSWMTSSNWFDINEKIIKSIASSPEAQNIYSAMGLVTGTID